MIAGHSLLFMYLLTTSQITQVQFTPEEHAPLVSCVALDQDLENCVRSTRMNIRLRLPRDSILLTSLEQYEAVVCASYDVFTLSLHKNTRMLVFPDIQCFV